MSTASRPLIAVTMGDAAGIGPEITVKALDRREPLFLTVDGQEGGPVGDDERVEDAGLEHDDAEDWASPGELPGSVGS